MNKIGLTTIGLDVITLPKVKMNTVGTESEGTWLRLILSDGSYYLDPNNRYYCVKK